MTKEQANEQFRKLSEESIRLTQRFADFSKTYNEACIKGDRETIESTRVLLIALYEQVLDASAMLFDAIRDLKTAK